jgi:5-formyltetrahydrofolate cyclo-ligase
MTDKQTLRKHYLTLRLALSPSQYDSLNTKICTCFFTAVDLTPVQTLHIFLPILAKKEPNTWLIIEHLQSKFPQLRISVPKMTDDHQLIHYYFENKTQVAENQWHIPEPRFGTLTPVDKIDMVIVPLLAFDKTGHRLGYGRGFYDRFLTTCRSDCKKIGLSFFEPTDTNIDADETDVALNQVITPTQSFAF